MGDVVMKEESEKEADVEGVVSVAVILTSEEEKEERRGIKVEETICSLESFLVTSLPTSAEDSLDLPEEDADSSRTLATPPFIGITGRKEIFPAVLSFTITLTDVIDAGRVVVGGLSSDVDEGNSVTEAAVIAEFESLSEKTLSSLTLKNFLNKSMTWSSFSCLSV